MKKNKKIGLFLALLLVCGMGFLGYRHFFLLTNLADNPEALSDLKKAWNNHQVIALIRHTERCDRSESPCLLGEDKGISVFGKETAVRLGKQFKQLLATDKITLYHSPLLRTTQTAQFMFGNRGEAKNWLREGCKEKLFGDIFKHKISGNNLVLVTHSSCLKKLADDANHKRLIHTKVTGHQTYGVIVFLKINEQQQKLVAMGYLLPKDWNRLLSFKNQ